MIPLRRQQLRPVGVQRLADASPYRASRDEIHRTRSSSAAAELPARYSAEAPLPPVEQLQRRLVAVLQELHLRQDALHVRDSVFAPIPLREVQR
jgi:hypothetical protein